MNNHPMDTHTSYDRDTCSTLTLPADLTMSETMETLAAVLAPVVQDQVDTLVAATRGKASSVAVRRKAVQELVDALQDALDAQ